VLPPNLDRIIQTWKNLALSYTVIRKDQIEDTPSILPPASIPPTRVGTSSVCRLSFVDNQIVKNAGAGSKFRDGNSGSGQKSNSFWWRWWISQMSLLVESSSKWWA